MSDNTSTAIQVCPECHAEVDWKGASWCPSCGFYPAMGRQFDAAPADDDEEIIYDHWWEAIPEWVWSLAVGIGCLVALSAAVRVLFADSPVRTWWTFGQMGLGLIVVGTAHFMAYMFGVSRSESLGPLDMVSQPVVTWQPVFAELPETSKLVSSMACGIAAILLAYFVIDGVDYGAVVRSEAIAMKRDKMEQAYHDEINGKNKQGEKKKTSAMGAMVQTVTGVAKVKDAVSGKDGAASPESGEDALTGTNGEAAATNGEADGSEMADAESAADDLAASNGAESGQADQQPSGIAGGGGGDAAATSPSETNDGSPPSLSTSGGNDPVTTMTSPVSTQTTAAAALSDGEVECLILGYTTNNTGEIRSLLLAAAPERRLLRFVAKVPVEHIDANVLAVLMRAFDDIPARRSLVRCPFGGRWVRPELFCIAAHDGWTAEGRLHDAEVTRLVIGTVTN